MQAEKSEIGEFYKGGFPKKINRGKYNLKLNQRLRSARRRKGLTAVQAIQELKKSGVSIGYSTLHGYEADESNPNHRYPSLQTVLGLADFYNCSLDYLFGISEKFRRQDMKSTSIDLVDILQSRRPLTYNGEKLPKAQKDMILKKLNKLL